MNLGSSSGYFYLDSWVLANVVQLGTQSYCRRFLNRSNDPCGRQFDQMTQAARSGVANIAEGSARRKTSTETEMRLTDVARSSLCELSGDYLNALLQRDRLPWPKDSAQGRAINAVRIERPCYGKDIVHDASRHVLRQKQRFATWLDAADPDIVANAQLILIARVINMLNHQLQAQGEQFRNEGGFREQLSKARLEARVEADKGPSCPQCGKPMLRRKARSGRFAGNEFWGCSDYPLCTATREV
jgi:four helix bundle suffix protein